MVADQHPVARDILLLGVDGGGTRCRARLCSSDGVILGEAVAGSANIRFGIAESFAAVRLAADACLHQANREPSAKIVACLALAGASEPKLLAKACAWPSPFLRSVLTTDAQAACMGAHSGADGGIIIVGTGSIAWARVGGRELRLGGWGFPISDEGSGAWMGFAALRRVQWALDGLIDWTEFLETVFARFDHDPHRIVRWMQKALPRDYATIAPLLIGHARLGDPLARDLMHEAANYIERMAKHLRQQKVERLSLMGGLAGSVEPYLSPSIRQALVPPTGDALSGALLLARREWEAMPLQSRRIESA